MNHQTANSSLTSNSSASSNLSPLVPPDKRPQPKEASAVDGTLPKSRPGSPNPRTWQARGNQPPPKTPLKVKTAAGTTPPPGAAAVLPFCIPPPASASAMWDSSSNPPTKTFLPAFGGLLSKLQSACGIHDFLSPLTVLLVQNRISTRRAAILAYLGQILLRTLPAIQGELEPAEPQIIFDLLAPSATTTSPPSAPWSTAGPSAALVPQHPSSPKATTATLPFRATLNDHPTKDGHPERAQRVEGSLFAQGGSKLCP